MFVMRRKSAKVTSWRYRNISLVVYPITSNLSLSGAGTDFDGVARVYRREWGDEPMLPAFIRRIRYDDSFESLMEAPVLI